MAPIPRWQFMHVGIRVRSAHPLRHPVRRRCGVARNSKGCPADERGTGGAGDLMTRGGRRGDAGCPPRALPRCVLRQRPGVVSRTPGDCSPTCSQLTSAALLCFPTTGHCCSIGCGSERRHTKPHTPAQHAEKRPTSEGKPLNSGGGALSNVPWISAWLGRPAKIRSFCD